MASNPVETPPSGVHSSPLLLALLKGIDAPQSTENNNLPLSSQIVRGPSQLVTSLTSGPLDLLTNHLICKYPKIPVTLFQNDIPVIRRHREDSHSTVNRCNHIRQQLLMLVDNDVTRLETMAQDDDRLAILAEFLAIPREKALGGGQTQAELFTCATSPEFQRDMLRLVEFTNDGKLPNYDNFTKRAHEKYTRLSGARRQYFHFIFDEFCDEIKAKQRSFFAVTVLKLVDIAAEVQYEELHLDLGTLLARYSDNS